MKGFAAGKAEFDGDGAFADGGIAVNVAHVVHMQHGGGEQAAAGCGQKHRRAVTAALQVVAADDAEQAEKAEDAGFAEGMVAVGVAADGVGDGGEDGKRAKQEKQQKVAPAGRADGEQGDAEGEAGKHARREQLAHLLDADRTAGGEATWRAGGAVAVGAAHAVAVVVGDVGEDLQG